MKRLLPFLLIGLLAFLALWLMLKDRSSTLALKPTDFIPQHPSIIQGFELSDSGGTLRFHRSAHGWMLEDSNSVKPELAERWCGQVSSFQLIAPVPVSQEGDYLKEIEKRGIHVVIYTHRKDKIVYTLLFSDTLKKEAILFCKKSVVRIRIPDMAAEDMPLYSTHREAWTEEILLNLNPVEVQEIYLENPAAPGSSFRLFLSHNQWYIQKLSPGYTAEPASKYAVSDWLQNFRWIPALKELDNLKNNGNKEIADHSPFYLLRITLSDHRVISLHVFRKKAAKAIGTEKMYDSDEVFVFLAEQKRTMLVKYSVFDNILIDYEYLKP